MLTPAGRSADDFAARVVPLIRSFMGEGVTYADIATKLNTHGTLEWHASTVCNVLKRAGKLATA